MPFENSNLPLHFLHSLLLALPLSYSSFRRFNSPRNLPFFSKISNIVLTLGSN